MIIYARAARVTTFYSQVLPRYPFDVKTGDKELFVSLRCMFVIVFWLVHSCKLLIIVPCNYIVAKIYFNRLI